jgi:hypothetical protein
MFGSLKDYEDFFLNQKLVYFAFTYSYCEISNVYILVSNKICCKILGTKLKMHLKINLFELSPQN